MANVAATSPDDRTLEIKGPGDMADMALVRFAAREEISRPFVLELDLLGIQGEAAAGNADAEGVLGQPVAITIDSVQFPRRPFHGVVTELAYTGYGERYHQYSAIVRPAFWLLTRRADCRIFQDQATPDIFREVCRQAGFNDYRLALSANYAPCEYRVQYRESDFDFLSRLLEHEGIYYYFEHQGDRHVMVLADDVGKLGSADGYERVPYYPPGGSKVQRKRDHLSSWSVARSFQPAAVAARDCRYGTSSGIAGGVSPVARRRSEEVSRFEMFEYPAGVNDPTNSNVERIAKLRAEQLQSSQTIMRGSGNAAGLAAGRLFELRDHPNSRLNKQYLVTATQCEMHGNGLQSGPGSEDVPFHIDIEAIDAREPYRPARITPKPLIQGTQTAVVVGKKESDEIMADELGCVRVQFHWDRAGKSDKPSSCWVRVAQAWAGKQWGALYVPRVGQEVVVSFIDGDPDRPLIIGSVYNPEQLPAYSPASRPTVSGIKSRSSAKGTAENFNEIRFDDKKGEEEIYVHAEKNLEIVVENNQTVTVGADKKDPGDRAVTIHNDDKLTVGRDREATVKGKETHTVEKDRTTTVKGNDASDVKKKYTLTAGDEITLKVGQAKIVMKSDGTIEIAGNQVKVKGTSKVDINGTQTAISAQQLDVKGTKAAVQGTAMLDLASSGIASLKGSLTKIG